MRDEGLMGCAPVKAQVRVISDRRRNSGPVDMRAVGLSLPRR
jgi:hypothetical protein